MANNTNVTLREVADLVRGVSYRPPDLLGPDDNSVPLLRATNIGRDALDLEDVLRVPERLVRNHQLLRKFDIVIAMSSGSRQAVGRLAQLRHDWCGCVGAFCGVIRADSGKIEPRYLGYVLRSPSFRERIETFAEGTAIMNLSRERLLGFQFEVPSKQHQVSIATILGVLDEKIELNRRMNATLEAMARALFKDWLVDFGPVRAKMEGRAPYLPDEIWRLFPGRLDEEGKPVGWEEKPLDEIAEFLNGLPLQKFPATYSGDSIPVIKIAELRNGVSAKSDRASRDVPAKYIIKDGDFLFSWSGSLLAKFWTEGEGALNQHLFKVSSDQFPMWFVSHWVHHHLGDFQTIAASKATTMGHIQRGHLTAAKTVCPPARVLLSMGVITAPLVEQAIKNEIESRTLADLRDTLLPKLISGDLRLPEAMMQVDAAIT